MKHRPLFVGLLFAALVACAPPVFSQAGRLQFDAAKVVRRYSIGGAGLEGKQGTWWSDARSGLLVAFELPVGDEPG